MWRAAQVLERCDRADRHAAPGRLDAPRRSSDLQRLAGDRGRRRVTEVHRQCVHDPGHRLTIRVDVRCRDVAIAADENRDLCREAARHVLELVQRELARIDDDAALGAAEGDVDHRALPGHPHRESLDLVERDVRVVADASFGGSAVDVVLHPITGEHARMAVVELDREMAGELALHFAKNVPQPWLEPDQLRGLVELRLRGAPFVRLDDGS